MLDEDYSWVGGQQLAELRVNDLPCTDKQKLQRLCTDSSVQNHVVLAFCDETSCTYLTDILQCRRCIPSEYFVFCYGSKIL